MKNKLPDVFMKAYLAIEKKLGGKPVLLHVDNESRRVRSSPPRELRGIAPGGRRGGAPSLHHEVSPSESAVNNMCNHTVCVPTCHESYRRTR